jgi:hypothetical protein
MKTIQCAELAYMIPELVNHVGESYVIIDERKKEIVGAITILDAPKSLKMNVKYEKRKIL